MLIEGDALVGDRGIGMPMLVRRRHNLSDVLRSKVADHGRAQVREAMKRLVREEPDSLHTSDEFCILIEEQNYAPLNKFTGHRFPKHAFDEIGQMNGEEAQCAARIDQHPNVARWIRNLDRETQGGFFLPLAPGKFFPDFIVELTDGSIALIKYKMGKLSHHPDELHKKAIGELWASRSSGRARFGWVVNKDWRALDGVLAK